MKIDNIDDLQKIISVDLKTDVIVLNAAKVVFEENESNSIIICKCIDEVQKNKCTKQIASTSGPEIAKMTYQTKAKIFFVSIQRISYNEFKSKILSKNQIDEFKKLALCKKIKLFKMS